MHIFQKRQQLRLGTNDPWLFTLSFITETLYPSSVIYYVNWLLCDVLLGKKLDNTVQHVKNNRF